MSHWQNWICPAIVAIGLLAFLLDVIGDFIVRVKNGDRS
jgi:hypothetical protein